MYHLVHNKNNKNDNTLKKRNALVTFEFKTLLDKVVPSSYPNYQESSDELIDLIPTSPFIYNESINNFNINIPNSNHSPPSFSSSSTSSSSSANNSSTSSSSSSQQIDNNENFRTMSPTNLLHTADVSPVNSSFLSQVISTAPVDLKKSKIEQSKKMFSSRPIDNGYNQRQTNNNQNITIWREELNAKNNYQQQLKKQVTIDFIDSSSI